MSRDNLNGLQLTIDRRSAAPAEEQLVSQLKLAIMLGTLKEHQTLPSVREIEEQTGVGRNVVWRAYSCLAKAGTIKLQARKRAVVNSNSRHRQARELIAAGDWLTRGLLDGLKALRINPESFLRLLSHRITETFPAQSDILFAECNPSQARRFAEDISTAWQIQLPGIEFKTLRDMAKTQRFNINKVITPLYHGEEVREILKDGPAKVITVRMRWNEQLLRELRALPPRSLMAFMLEASALSGYGQALAQELTSVCPNLKVELLPWTDGIRIRRLMKSGKYKRVLLSAKLWGEVDEQVRKSPVFVQRALEIDKSSLEEVRIDAGVIL